MSVELHWSRKPTGIMVATGTGGETYEVRWQKYGKGGKSWTAYVNGEPIPLSFSGRRKDAMDRAQREAERRERKERA